MWKVDGETIECTECGKTAPVPFAPCQCKPEAEPPPPPTEDYLQRLVASLDDVERELLAVFEKGARLAASSRIQACNALMKLADYRHDVFLKSREANGIDKLNAQLAEIRAHLAGHALGNTNLDEDEDDPGSQGDSLQ